MRPPTPRWTLALLVVLVLALVALAPTPADLGDGADRAGPDADGGTAAAGAAATPPTVTGADGREYRLNLWLLDGPNPSNTLVSHGAEPDILADRNGEYLWIADTSGGYVSTDDGQSWRRMNTPFLLVADGWSLAQDQADRLYAATTSLPYIEVRQAANPMGTAWELSGRVADVAPIADRPWIAAWDANGVDDVGPDGRVALFFYDFGRTFSESCALSLDAATTFVEHRPLAGSPQAGNAVFDDAGNLYYVDDSGVLSRFTPDAAGLTCIHKTKTYPMFPGGKGSQHMLQVDVGSGGALYSAAPTPNNDAIVLSGVRDLDAAYPDQPDRKTLVVSGSALESNTFAAVSARGNEIAVAWYGSETPGDPNDPGFDGSWNVYLAVVQGFWSSSPSITHVRLTDEPNHVGDICMDGIGCGGGSDRDLLDYFGVDHGADGDVHIAYGHDGAGSNARVFHARVP